MGTVMTIEFTLGSAQTKPEVTVTEETCPSDWVQVLLHFPFLICLHVIEMAATVDVRQRSH